MKDLLKLVACWIAFFLALMVGGGVTALLHLKLVAPGHETRGLLGAVLVGAGVLVVGLYPMARGLAGSRLARSVAMGGFIFLALGLNTVIEARVFSAMLTGVEAGNVLMYAIEALFLGTAMGLCFGGGEKAAQHEWRPGDLGRAVVAWLGWPVIYFVFGMCVAPIVMPYYQSGAIIGLHIPPLGVIVGTQLVRSVPFLICSLPLIVMWKGSRLGLWLALGLAHTVAVGLFGTVSGTFLPMVLRVTHSIEIACDSFAYAGMLVLLFSRTRAVRDLASQHVGELASQR